MEGELYDYLSTVENTTIIDALRPNSTYTLEINNDDIINNTTITQKTTNIINEEDDTLQDFDFDDI